MHTAQITVTRTQFHYEFEIRAIIVNDKLAHEFERDLVELIEKHKLLDRVAP